MQVGLHIIGFPTDACRSKPRILHEEYSAPVRVTLHRVRDNIATEAVEQVASGLSVASGVLGYIDKVNDKKSTIRARLGKPP